ncbi:MAG: NADH-quinone oxidoreductase subunit G [Sulfurovum sp.]|nr:NADH-quinone oxidoreductase subunit G [Sulfurovum sp.]MCB4749585.1 NADH-quinone oxidoreductase subunit G [Sulfurovum sp.]MCB4750092.1 NADH-quinone oxidoreductase subunit G [Sulfurovum sp.]MCB4754038.1 NADH-quinone oxidoreductase subunit G [Sulfurovum sp.]MCB4765805.1 NADH-quinone oxidoreductase subunit G [Sulfurovum sp.]
MSEVKTVESMVTITIDGKIYQAKEGEYILNAARANNVFIPAICYLTRCSPTLACRLCLVEVDGKQVYACNAKVKEDMEITVDTPNILEERRAIMEVYDVNHPLQCGVCDKSGECELQNYTLELAVDSQSYAIPDTKRETKNWSSVLHYDAGLCIVCERCTTVCKDMIGDTAISTTKRGGEVLDKGYKETMPKDAYAMWNKLQKSIIAPSNGTDFTDCSDCGECTAVCPVGALTGRDFVYASNAWELNRVPATCAHCSSGCQIYYETKHTSVFDRSEKIYRVTNEWNYVSLCGAGRYGYDFENYVDGKDEVAFNRAIEALKKADTIRFNSVITNEEALMLQTLKEKMGVKLVNSDAYAFQKFLGAYSIVAGHSLYSYDFKQVMATDFVISIGASLRNDNPNARYAFNNVQKLNKGAGLYFHPVGDTLVPTFGKSVEVFTHKVGLEEAALYLILDLFSDKKQLPTNVKEYIDSFKSTITKTVKETVIKEVIQTVIDEETGEEKEVKNKASEVIEKEITIEKNGLIDLLGGDSNSFTETFKKMMKKKETFSMIIGEDLYFHPKAENIARLIALIEQTSPIHIAMIPPKTNSLGVALICDLDNEATGYTVGYNENGDFKLSALGDGDLDMPAMNQQEGTLTNMHKRVTPTNAALEYKGYNLNDLMKVLVGAPNFTVDWTEKLPMQKGFKKTKFDDLPNGYLNNGTENRGYMLENIACKVEEIEVKNFDENEVLEGEIIYRCNPQRQFNDFSNKAHQIFEAFGLYVSSEKAKELGKKVEIDFDGRSITVDVIVDDRMTGDIAALSDFKSAEDVYSLFGNSRYQKVTMRKV